jgi:hypothetical protein
MPKIVRNFQFDFSQEAQASDLATNLVVEDPHVQARGMIESIEVNSAKLGTSWTVKMPGVSPILDTAGGTRWAG